MTLRLRLVLALVALVTVGLAIFGVATYVLYARSEYQRLDDQIQAFVPLVTGQLYQQAGLGEGHAPANDDNGGPGARPRPPTFVPPSTYAELRSPSGQVLATSTPSTSTSVPDLPADLAAPATGSHLFTTGSETGSGQWRVSVTASNQGDGNVVVVAVPLGEVSTSLHRLVYIEATAAAILLAILAVGAWLILRRGLRPLEQMASSARSITAGDLSQRVSPSDERTEVGQLGLALNTMLAEIEAAFREREATERRLRQFLADASHELRTPLTSIQGFAELFRLDGGQDRVDLGIILRRVEEETARMKALVEDLLLLARLDETRPPQRVPVDLAVLGADACSDAIAVDPSRRVVLDAPDPVVVLGDTDHLRQAIANLVTNAVRHTPTGTAIEVTARSEDGVAVVIVRDRGPGLSPEAFTHAFDRFWQADHARTGAGAGLGLSIVAAIVHEHGGTVTAANAPDGGAVFTIRLPIEVSVPEQEPAPAPTR
jgi:two-component system OmpR family sensor kinase